MVSVVDLAGPHAFTYIEIPNMVGSYPFIKPYQAFVAWPTWILRSWMHANMFSDVRSFRLVKNHWQKMVSCPLRFSFQIVNTGVSITAYTGVVQTLTASISSTEQCFWVQVAIPSFCTDHADIVFEQLPRGPHIMRANVCEWESW